MRVSSIDGFRVAAASVKGLFIRCWVFSHSGALTFVMRLPKKLVFVGLVLLVVMAPAVWYGFGFNEATADFEAVGFHDAYRESKAANQRYLRRTIAVRGEVLSVEHSWLTPRDWKTVAIGKKSAGVMCQFSTDAVEQAERLIQGQVVVIRGVCIGEFAGWPVLSECEVESTNWPRTMSNLWKRSE
jgi:hypothetical protein